MSWAGRVEPPRHGERQPGHRRAGRVALGDGDRAQADQRQPPLGRRGQRVGGGGDVEDPHPPVGAVPDDVEPHHPGEVDAGGGARVGHDGLRPPLADPPVDGQRPDDAVALGGDHGGVARGVGQPQPEPDVTERPGRRWCASRGGRRRGRAAGRRPARRVWPAWVHVISSSRRGGANSPASYQWGTWPKRLPSRPQAEIEPSLSDALAERGLGARGQREPGVDRRAPQLAATTDGVRADVGGADRRRVDHGPVEQRQVLLGVLREQPGRAGDVRDAHVTLVGGTQPGRRRPAADPAAAEPVVLSRRLARCPGSTRC